MQLRSFGKTGWQASALGFGCMRFPTLSGKPNAGDIDEARATAMLHRAIEGGVNYLDTAYVYHDGQSESFVGRALAGGWRDKVRLATKLPVWEVAAPEDFDRLLDEQRKRLNTDVIDFYLLHALDAGRWSNIVCKHKLLDKAAKAIADGRIGALGFSFHDNYDAFEPILYGGKDLWSFCQIQYNYMDVENQAGVRGLKAAAGLGLAVVVMEPLLGGRLAEPPKEILPEIEAHPVQKKPAAWALEWLWNQPEVSVVLSGMSTMEQLEENLVAADRARVDAFTEADLTLVDKVRRLYKARTPIPCTKCGYCMPCPNGVNIPANFEFFNHAALYEDLPGARFRYNIFLKPEQKADGCIECGACEAQCPQSIAITEWLPKVAAQLGGQ